MADAVLTRELAECEAYRAPLAALGLDLIAMPVTTAVACEDGALAAALARGGHAAIVVTSRRAAAEVARHGASAEVWVVGDATARPLAAAGIAVVHPEGAVDGESLARALARARALVGQRVLVPRAEQGRPEASEILRAAGAIVEEVVAYRVEPTPADAPALARGKAALATAAVCVVFAPSQVSALAALVGPLGAVATRFCAIGATTAAALRDAGVAEVAVAPTPTPEGIAQAVRSVYPPRR